MLTHTILRFGPLGGRTAAVACSDQQNANMAPQRPSFWVTPPRHSAHRKWTGGGRIDPTGIRTAANYDNVDEPHQLGTASSSGADPLFHREVYVRVQRLPGDERGQSCFVQKGEIEVNGHPFKVAWHVSIHDGSTPSV